MNYYFCYYSVTELLWVLLSFCLINVKLDEQAGLNVVVAHQLLAQWTIGQHQGKAFREALKSLRSSNHFTHSQRRFTEQLMR